MMKRNKAILCALAGIGVITSVGTVKANAMTMTTNTKVTQSKYTAYNVMDMIYSLPSSYEITLENKDEVKKQVKEVRDAYDSLKEDKSMIENYDLYYLKDSESRIQYLEKVESDKTKAQDLVRRISELKNEVVSGSTRGYNSMFKVDKDKLRANAEKIRQIRSDYNTLDYSVTYGSNNLVTNYEDFVKIECRLAEL